jgi:hypothetical protein
VKLFLIEWIDSHGCVGWNPLDELAAVPMNCKSVGWLVKRESGITVLASSISGEKNGDLRLFARGDLAIPDCCITKRVEIRSLPPRKRKAGKRRRKA